MVLIMYKYHLKDVEWKAFKVGEEEGVFNVSNSKPYHKSNLNTTQHGIPYITRTSINNGLEDIVIDNNYEKNKKNSISLGAENADFFFQSIDYVTGNKMYHISNEKITRHIGLFLVQAFRQSIKNCGFGYGKGLTGTRFKNRYVMLPIDEKNNPNWHFMEEYIKERENEKRQEIKDYYKNRLLDLVICPEVLTDVEWGEFRVKDLFEMKSVKGKTIKNYKSGTIPYVTTSSTNNGVSDFIDTPVDISLKNCISVDPIAGKTFHHEYEFVGRGGAGSAINLLYSDKLNHEIGKFICSAMEKTSLGKASYAVALNGDRLKNSKLLLPIDKEGNPNWTYMENFIKNIEQKQIKNVLKYLDEYIYIYNV